MKTNLPKDDLFDYIKKSVIWNPNKYLNVWVGTLSDGGFNSDGSSSYKVSKPNVILSGQKPIPGINAREIETYILGEEFEITDFGIAYNRNDFLSPSKMSGSKFSLARIIGEYYGLYTMKFDEIWDWNEYRNVSNMVDGDTDFCADTPVYDYNFSLYKKDKINGNYYMSYNIMEDYSQHNSITYNQAQRVRDVLKKCPSRWSYKSKWAFTGKDDENN